MSRFSTVLIPLFCILFGVALAPETGAQSAGDAGQPQSADTATIKNDQPDDTIARVGDQPITFSQIDIMLNSSAVVGVALPPPGTPARNQVRLTILDRVVSANLIYLDALDKGADKNPVFQHDVQQFADTSLTAMYREKYLIGELPITEEEIMDYYKNNIAEDTPFTQDVSLAIEASLRKKRFKVRVAGIHARLREGVEVVVNEAQLDPAQDAGREASTVVATIDKQPITWGDVSAELSTARNSSSPERRLAEANRLIDQRIMLAKANTMDLEQEPYFQVRMDEFRKVRLITMHRGRLVEQFEPTDDEIRAYFEKHQDKISVNEARKVQMVVMSTKEDADKVKQQIESGELTIYEAAKEYSIDPNARKTLGEMGWVAEGSGFPALDQLTFSLQPEEIGGPVESPAGWHLVKVLDVRDAEFKNISEAATWQKTRRLINKERMDEYTANLRKNVYKVEVYIDVFNRIIEEEAKKIQKKLEKQQQAES
jgi:peptidyl-prolyl cis-trans isomerase C